LARTLAILTITLTGITSMYAGSLGINPGDYLNPDGSVSIGLLANVGAASGFGLTSNPDGITGTNFSQTSYDAAGAILYGSSANVPQTSVSCTVNCQGGQTIATPVKGASTIYQPAAAPEFDLLGDGSFADRGTSSTAWISTGNGVTSTLTIPVGIFGVQDVATLLNTTGGVMTGGTVCAGATTTATANTTCTNTRSYSYVTLEFNTTDATGLTGTDFYETVSLINGVTQRNILDGTCVNGAGSFCSGTGPLATAQSNGLVVDPTTGIMYTIDAENAFTGFTSANTKGSNAPANNSTMFLDAQLIPVFSEDTGAYLVSVSVTNTGANNGANYNEEVLSGLTVTASPEPSTILLLLGGLGVIGASRLRRKSV
jgi:hypothetical protein